MKRNDLLEQYKINYDKLIDYGFTKKNNNYFYSKPLQDDFDIQITINKDIDIKVYDTAFEEEYLSWTYTTQLQGFASIIKDKVNHVLEDIINNCFTYIDVKQLLVDKIKDTYHLDIEYLWEKYPHHGIVRTKYSKKWFVLFMDLDPETIHLNQEGRITVMNVKVPSDTIDDIIDNKTVFPAYHMNKKYWVTIKLDARVPLETYFNYIQKSYELTEDPLHMIRQEKEWIVPANPRLFNLIQAFQQSDELPWNQTAHIQVGDIVYIYYGAPYSCILYKCVATMVNIEYERTSRGMKYLMMIKKLKMYDRDQYPLSLLKQYGVKAIRSARYIPKELSDYIEGDKHE